MPRNLFRGGFLSEQGLIKSLREQLAEGKISQEKVAEEDDFDGKS
jgi:hypothetical protein